MEQNRLAWIRPLLMTLGVAGLLPLSAGAVLAQDGAPPRGTPIDFERGITRNGTTKRTFAARR